MMDVKVQAKLFGGSLAAIMISAAFFQAHLTALGIGSAVVAGLLLTVAATP